MKIIPPSFEIMTPLCDAQILEMIEKIGRVCYKSEASISKGSAQRFVQNILKNGHESVIEHCSITVKVICDRGISHEIVRHRLASYSQESTRYCNYSSGKFGNELTVIRPYFWDEAGEKYRVWKQSMESAEKAYQALIGLGASPQEARSVLPNSLKTELVMTMNLREWRHFFRLRTDSHAHPQMREITIPMLREFQKQLPGVFDDIILE